MPAPDPNALEYSETSDGRPVLHADIPKGPPPFPLGCRRTRIARMRSVMRRLQFDGWTCPGCGDDVPLWRRADAKFCSTGCRKRAARKRRHRLAVNEAVERALRRHFPVIDP